MGVTLLLVLPALCGVVCRKQEMQLKVVYGVCPMGRAFLRAHLIKLCNINNLNCEGRVRDLARNCCMSDEREKEETPVAT